MDSKSNQNAFTLIELLVVIAIIGVLTSIILTSLNSSRARGNDARIMQEVLQIRTQLERDMSVGTYPDLVAAGQHFDTVSNANITVLVNDILALNKGMYNFNQGLVIYSTAVSGSLNDYAVYAKTSTGYFCVDSYGHALQNNSGAYIPQGNSPLQWPGTTACQ